MRIRYDLYVEFEDPQQETAADVSRSVAKNSFGNGVMGVAAPSLHEEGYVLTAMLFLDPALVFEDVEADFPSKLPTDIEQRLEDEVVGYRDAAVQRVKSD